MNPLFEELWSPYVVGMGIGVLVWLSFLLSDKAIGCSTAYARTAGMTETALRGEKVKERLYYKEFLPTIDWEWMLVLGVVVGAFLSSLISGSFRIELIPTLWNNTFGGSIILRFFAALIGGILIGFGARMAGGCTSGHGISGTLQLAVGSWLALIMFFIGGIFTAFLLFGGG